MTKTLIRRFALFSILILPLPGIASAKGGDESGFTIADARRSPLESVVTVTGTVTTPPGAFNSSFFDLGFGLQDEKAGIFVSSQVKFDAKPGDRARVTGVLRDSFGLLILVPAAVSDVGLKEHKTPVRAKFTATGDIGEETEGRIVKVVGQVTDPVSADLPFGYKFAVDDGSGPIQIFINLETGIDPTDISVGERISVTGFSSQFDTHYEIDPRFPRDIKRLRH